ncbi:MAG: hypothetical protein H7320_13795, partial [Ferruginibacter sp.]|nr:hypothetical protein [Ferruginibacter sp.]
FDYCKMTETTFRARLRELAALKLVTIKSKPYHLTLVSYEKAAEILGIEYEGLVKLDYDISIDGKQVFQYFIRGEEIRNNQQAQLEALHYRAKKNPLLWQHLMILLAKEGISETQLVNDALMFQVLLLKLQQTSFRYGSELYEVIHTLRADINRSVKTIKKAHNYKAKQSVSYMTARMEDLKIIDKQALIVFSPKRSHIYLNRGDGPRVELSRWIEARQETAWNLPNQITLNYKTDAKKKQMAGGKQAAN